MNENRPQVSSEILLQLYETMLRIRMFEERTADLLVAKQIKCPSHLYIGQEAVATGVCANLQRRDYAFGTYRSHGFYLAKGGNLNELMAELYCKASGCSRGRGGSMHVIAPEVGILGTTAIVGGGLPLAVGSALAVKMARDDRIVACFFGDGATDEGVFYESINFASLKSLPIVFVCENNLYSTHLPLKCRQRDDNIHEKARAFGLPSVRIDGNDVLEVYVTARSAIEHLRAGKGPFFIECRTYRWRSHVGPWHDLNVGFRTEEEVNEWKKRCPIQQLEETLLDRGVLDHDKKSQLVKRILEEIDRAHDLAKSSAYPERSELERYVYEDSAPW